MSAPSPAPLLELTPDGWQYLMPGFLPADHPQVLKARLEVLAARPWQSKRPQEACDFGLFDGEARKQLELF